MTSSLRWVGSLVRWPVFWGGIATIAFLQLLRSGRLDSPLLARYVDGHPIERIEVLLFFVGMAALVVKALSALRELRACRARLLESAPEGGEEPSACEGHLAALATLPRRIKESKIGARVRGGIEYVRRNHSAQGLEGELRQLADADALRLDNEFAFVRIVIWAIPILGFLGTVIGITQAIAVLSPEALEQSLDGVTAGLAVAFDTTALALALSMALMFVQYLTGRLEGRLLRRLDETAAAVFADRFRGTEEAHQAQLVAIRRMSESILAGTERLVQRQAELWRESLRAAQDHWRKAAQAGGDQFRDELNLTLARSLEQHAKRLVELEDNAREAHKRHWAEVRGALERLSDALTSQQAAMLRQGDVLLKAVDASQHIQKLETALNENLAALVGAKHFEETVMSLAATANLLLMHLRRAEGEAARVTLNPEHVPSRAA